MRTLVAMAIGCLLALAGAPAQAHTGSYDMKYVDGSNLILLTFNTHQPVSGLDIEHNIRLYDLVGAPIPYDEVRVEVHTQEGSSGVEGLESSLRKKAALPMLATNESTMDFTYPAPGPYRLTTVFYAGGREISRGTFAIDIGKGTDAPGRGFGVWSLGVAFLLGAAATWVLRRRRPRREPDEPATAAAGDADQATSLRETSQPMTTGASTR